MFESLRTGNSINLAKHLRLWLLDKSVWVGALIVGLVVAYIEIGRRLSIAVPIPFLILLGIVVLVASLGGKRSGIAGACIASSFIFYSTVIGFGPATLTGGPVQAFLGIALMLVVGYFLGRTRDQNRSMIKALEETHIELERRVAKRTAELSVANERLNDEIEERAQVEKALRANEIYFRSLIENALDIVTILEADGTIRYESPSIRQALGYEPEELIGKNAFDFIHPEDVARVNDYFNEWKEIPGRSRVIELRFHHKNGSWRILEVIGNNLVDNPNVGGMVINSRDITQRRTMEKTVQKQEQLALVGQLAAGIAHDFNNVMAVILLYAQMLGLSPNLTEKQKKQLKTIYDEGRRAADLTTQILDFGRQSVLDRKLLNLSTFMENFVNLLRRTLPDDIEVIFEHGDGEYLISADSNRIQQALMNLALNSKDAMPEGGRIRIQLSHVQFSPNEREPVPVYGSKDWVKISLSDNGSGISEEVLGHIFEPFFTTKEPGQGTGLGLAQVYGIVKQHEGFIEVESKFGTGSLFSIIFPHAEVKQLGETDPKQVTLRPGNGELILVVEDNQATSIALMTALETLNYKALGAENGLEALYMIENYPQEVSLVMSDVVMPEMGGMALMRTLREKGISTPMVLLTGNSGVDEKAVADAGDQIEWYRKPIPLQTLAEIVAGKIAGRDGDRKFPTISKL